MNGSDWYCVIEKRKPTERRCRWDQGIGAAVKALNPKFHTKTWEFFRDLRVCAEVLESAAPELVAHFRSRGALRPHDCIAAGHPVGHPAD